MGRRSLGLVGRRSPGEQEIRGSLPVFPERDRLVGLEVKATAPRAAGFGSIPALAVDLCPGYTSDLKIGSPVATPCQASSVIRSSLGLVGPVSVHCD